MVWKMERWNRDSRERVSKLEASFAFVLFVFALVIASETRNTCSECTPFKCCDSKLAGQLPSGTPILSAWLRKEEDSTVLKEAKVLEESSLFHSEVSEAKLEDLWQHLRLAELAEKECS